MSRTEEPVTGPDHAGAAAAMALAAANDLNLAERYARRVTPLTADALEAARVLAAGLSVLLEEAVTEGGVERWRPRFARVVDEAVSGLTAVYNQVEGYEGEFYSPGGVE